MQQKKYEHFAHKNLPQIMVLSGELFHSVMTFLAVALAFLWNTKVTWQLAYLLMKA